MLNPATSDDPIADFARSYRAELAAELADKAEDDEQSRGAELPGQAQLFREVDDPRTWAWAAVGAVNRRDHSRALIVVQQLLRDRDHTMQAIEVLTGILLVGVPQTALTPSCRIPVEFDVVPGEEQCPKAVGLASDLLTGVAKADSELVGPALLALAGDHGLDILFVLVLAAAARIESFVGLDGDTVDAYYRISREVGVS